MNREILEPLANIVFWAHILVVVLLLGSCFLQVNGFRSRHAKIDLFFTYLSACTIGSQILFLGCPMVLLENSIRKLYDPNVVYYGSFVAYVVIEKLGIPVPVVVLTMGTYLTLILGVLASALIRGYIRKVWCKVLLFSKSKRNLVQNLTA